MIKLTLLSVCFHLSYGIRPLELRVPLGRERERGMEYEYGSGVGEEGMVVSMSRI